MVRPRIVAPTRTRSPGDVFEEVFMTTVTRLGEAVNLHVERTTETIEDTWAPGTFLVQNDLYLYAQLDEIH